MRNLVFWLSLSAASWSAPVYHQRIPVDLDGDGVSEQVALQLYGIGSVSKAQLVVLDSRGRLLWQAPRVKEVYSDSPWSFLGEFDMGDICWVDDYDQDGRVDLCATRQKSDVSPTRYRLFHWDGQRFVYDRTAMLVNVPQKPATYQWTRYDPAVTHWVESMGLSARGEFPATIATIPEPNRQVKFHYQPGEGFILSP